MKGRRIIYFLSLGVILNLCLVSAVFIDISTPNQILYDCGDLNTTGAVYTMNQSINSSGTCINVVANNITIDGNGFSITGDGTSYGINFSATSLLSSPNTILENVSINNFSSDVFGNGIKTSDIGSNAGQINIFNSAINTIKALGGDYVGTLCSAGGGGSIILVNSNVSNITIYGGLGSGLGGGGGSVFANYSNITNILAYGPSAIVGGGGGSVTLFHSYVRSINAYGGTSSGSGEDGVNGGTVTCRFSYPMSINVRGGKAGGGVGGVGGNGGSIYIEGDILNVVNSSFNLAYGTGKVGNGTSGTLILNYTNSFSDNDTEYGNRTDGTLDQNNLQLSVINPFGTIDWRPNVIDSISLTNISQNLILGNNSAFLNSSNMPSLNLSANITFYGLPTTMINPRILKNGALCEDCYNFTSLDAGTVMFNVSSWSDYTIAYDSPAVAIITNSGNPGGGGGSLASTNKEWLLTKVISDEQLIAGANILLGPKQKAEFNLIDYALSFFGIKTVDEAVIIAKTSINSQNTSTSPGKILKFDFSDSGYYDLIVFINSIDNGKVNITLKKNK